METYHILERMIYRVTLKHLIILKHLNLKDLEITKFNSLILEIRESLGPRKFQ